MCRVPVGPFPRNGYSLAHRAAFQGEPYAVRVTVQEDTNGNRTYTVEFSNLAKKETTDAAPRAPGAAAEAVGNPGHPSQDSILRGVLGVNTENSGPRGAPMFSNPNIYTGSAADYDKPVADARERVPPRSRIRLGIFHETPAEG